MARLTSPSESLMVTIMSETPKTPIVPPGKPPPPPPPTVSPEPPPRAPDDEDTTSDDTDPDEPMPVAMEASARRVTMPSDPDMPWLRDVELELLREVPAAAVRELSPYGTVTLYW